MSLTLETYSVYFLIPKFCGIKRLPLKIKNKKSESSESPNNVHIHEGLKKIQFKLFIKLYSYITCPWFWGALFFT